MELGRIKTRVAEAERLAIIIMDAWFSGDRLASYSRCGDHSGRSAHITECFERERL